MVDSSTMAHVCLHIRGQHDSLKQHPDMTSLLISFFLHVYHAKINQQTLAMMFIQEAMNGARILQLDRPRGNIIEADANAELITDEKLVFPLLWVSER